MFRDPDKIKQAWKVASALKRLAPERDGKGKIAVTHCNEGLAVELAEVKLRGLLPFPIPLANDIHDILDEMSDPEKNKHPAFRKITNHAACFLAARGWLIIAAKKNRPHGHVVILYPSQKLEYSSNFAALVPMCCNIGVDVAIKGINWAFSKMPNYYLYVG